MTTDWSAHKSVHGFAVDELISALQKSIRRGQTENAVLVGTEIFLTSSELEDHLWQRLEIITVEDVGFGRLESPALIGALESFRRNAEPQSTDRLVFAIHAIRILAQSRKDRTSHELASWSQQVIRSGAYTPDISDVALDSHTRRGREMGRDYRHWFEQGAQVANEIPNRDETYRNRLAALLESSEEQT